MITSGSTLQRTIGYTDKLIPDRTDSDDPFGRGLKPMLIIPSTDEEWAMVTKDESKRSEEEIEAINQEYSDASRKLTWLLRCELLRYLGEDKQLPKGMLQIADGFFSFEGVLDRLSLDCRRSRRINSWGLALIARFSERHDFSSHTGECRKTPEITPTRPDRSALMMSMSFGSPG